MSLSLGGIRKSSQAGSTNYGLWLYDDHVYILFRVGFKMTARKVLHDSVIVIIGVISILLSITLYAVIPIASR
jgi:hypothetical protein